MIARSFGSDRSEDVNTTSSLSLETSFGSKSKNTSLPES